MEFTDYDTRVAAYALVVDGDRVLLTWYNGEGRVHPRWSLPGGGVEFEETLEEAAVRETREESGYDVRLVSLLTTHSFTRPVGPTTGRPFRSLRVVYTAAVVGGTLGTLEVGGSTDHAAWVPLAAVPDETRSDIVDVALAAWLDRRARG